MIRYSNIRPVWRTMDQVLLGIRHKLLRDGDGRWTFVVERRPIEGMTATGVRVKVWYEARGDFLDRWVDRHGRPVEIVRWRPCDRRYCD